MFETSNKLKSELACRDVVASKNSGAEADTAIIWQADIQAQAFMYILRHSNHYTQQNC